MLAIAIKNSIRIRQVFALGLVYLALALWFIPGYIIGDANLIMGLALIPYISTVDRGQRSLRYLIPALVAIVLAILAPVNTLFFLALLFVTLLLAENTIGRVNHMVLCVVLLISPVFGHVARLVEFPVRLWLSEQVARTLAFTGIPATAAGNLIMLGNTEFSVDPACAGLNMLVMSVLIGLFVLGWYQRRLCKTLGFKYLALLCMATVALNVVCNFFRILLLVRFAIMPGTFLHDAVGVGCLALYVLLPLLVGIKPILTWLGKPGSPSAPLNFTVLGMRHPFLHITLLVTMLFLATRITKADSLVNAAIPISLPGYQETKLSGGILKFENKEALIYIKPTAFYAPEHDPMICWTGSGYQFRGIRKDVIAGYEIYTATLVKNNDRIYTAWWFDNGTTKTISQFAWRWSAAKDRSKYCLININASSQAALKETTTGMLTKNVFEAGLMKDKNASAR